VKANSDWERGALRHTAVPGCIIRFSVKGSWSYQPFLLCPIGLMRTASDEGRSFKNRGIVSLEKLYE
jgi:hypothetical protein